MRSPFVDELILAWHTLNSTHCEKPFCHGTHVLRLEYENALETARRLIKVIDPTELTPEECKMLVLDAYRLNWEIGFNNAHKVEGEPDHVFRPPWRRDERLSPQECEICYEPKCDLCHPHSKSGRADLRDEHQAVTEAFVEGMPRGLPRFMRQFEETA